MENRSTRSWFHARAVAAGEAEISIYDEIGLWGVTAKDFRDSLDALGDVQRIALRINSPGGDVFDGLAIYNMLRRHGAIITATIDGVAASMASVIAMAGDTVTMPENSMLMIHDPSGAVIGTSKDMRELADALDKIKEGLVGAYASKSGLSRGQIAELMADETWLTAKEAVELGFADGIEAPVRMAARFDLSRFRHPPSELSARNRKDKAMAEDDAVSQPSVAEPEQDLEDELEQKDEKETAVSAAPAEDRPVDVQNSALDAAIKEERKRVSDIMAACSLVGRVDLASGYIAEGKGLGDVVAALQHLKVQSSSEEVVTRHRAGGDMANGPLRVDLAANMRQRAGIKEG